MINWILSKWYEWRVRRAGKAVDRAVGKIHKRLARQGRDKVV
jgi:hypothetical protein